MTPPKSLPAKGLRLVALLNAAAGAASHKGADSLRAELASALDALDVVAELKFCGGSELRLLAEAALSFLGLGTPPPTPSWGNILSEGRDYMRLAPWISVFPGLFILLSVLGVNLLGDGLRDTLDPRAG